MSQKDKNYLFINQTYPVIHKLYSKIKDLFQKYSNLLTKVESKFGSIVGDFFSSKEELQQKDKYMNGIEKLDFGKEDQLVFIQNSYIKESMKELKGEG